MLKSELIKSLQSNLDKYGDGEIQVELLTDLSEMGKTYEINDVTNATGYEFDADYITCLIKKEL